MGGRLLRTNLVSCVFLLMVHSRFSAAASRRSPVAGSGEAFSPRNQPRAGAVRTSSASDRPASPTQRRSSPRKSHAASSTATRRPSSPNSVGMISSVGALHARHQDKIPAVSRRVSSTSNPPVMTSRSGPAIRILAYGDSLTAGWHDDGESLTPYAPTLEERLRQLVGHKDIIVRHRGLSGWTAQSMAQAADQDGIGIRAILRKADANVRASDSDREVAGVAGVPEEKRHTITACIIIAGTNDLGTTSSHEEIFDHIMELHAVAHAQGIHTISVDIPPSAGTHRGPTKYRKTHEGVNKKLQETSLTSDMRIHVPCPIKWYPEGRPGSELWEEDGLHMSGQGYKELGNGLAPSVYGALTKWGIVPNPGA